jgi:predicted esterase
MLSNYKKDKIYLHEWWEIEVSYHPTKTGRIIINIPGADGSSEGYMNKYINLGNLIQTNNTASFVRIPNERPQEFLLTARTVINYCLENSKKICGSEKPEIWLMGFSAGGASALLSAWEYPEITKVLVINPFLNLDELRKSVGEYLPLYKGELFVVIGSEDSVTAPDMLEYIKRYSDPTSSFSSHIIQNCGHQLRGEDNSKILSQLPEYYFLGRYRSEEFPIAKDGVFLLENGPKL